jgi:hypothetical protein
MITTYIIFSILFLLFIYIGKYIARLSYFIDFCFNSGNIFDWYYSILLKIEEKNPRLSKLLGMCNVCLNFWISSILFFTLFDKLINGNDYLHLMIYIMYISSSTYNSLLLNNIITTEKNKTEETNV